MSEALRDVLTAAVDAAPQDGAPVNDAPIESAPTVETPSESRARDESGRFTKSEAAPAPATAPSAAPQAPEQATVGTAPPSVEPPAAAATVEAPPPRPVSWKGGEVEKQWAALPPVIQQEILRREAAYEKGVAPLRQQIEQARPLMDALAPHAREFAQYNVNTGQLVGNLLSSYRTLALGAPQAKLDMIQSIAQANGIPIQALYDANARQQWLTSAPAPAPQPAQQPANVEAIVEQTLLRREIDQQIATMQSDHVTYPYFQYLRPTMSEYMRTGEAGDLQQAYQMALEAPEHAPLVNAQQASQAAQQARDQEAQRAAAAQKHLTTARAAAVSPRSSTPSGVMVTAGKKALRDQIAEQVEAAGGRV